MTCLSPFKETSGHSGHTLHQTELTSQLAEKLKTGLNSQVSVYQKNTRLFYQYR